MYFKTHLCQPNRRSLTRFLAAMDKYLGFAFHPDTYAEEYIRFNKEGEEEMIFTLGECIIINENLKMAHGHFVEAIYDLCNMIRNIKP